MDSVFKKSRQRIKLWIFIMKNKYKITNSPSSNAFRISLPSALVSALGKSHDNEFTWKLHPNGKDLILEWI